MYSGNDIADYYRQTLVHYKRWWGLDHTRSLHYGVHYPSTRSFAEALVNTNKLLADIASIQEGERVLDAGCGVGGSALFLWQTRQCRVSGITLSPVQQQIASALINDENKDHIDFSVMDYTNTSFADGTFDVVLACESTCHATPKEAFLREACRVLKPGGRLVLCDFFTTGRSSAKPWVRLWADTWAVNEFNSKENFIDKLEPNGFSLIKNEDHTAEIYPSALRMYRAYLLGSLPAQLYNLFHKGSTFGRGHFRTGLFQYKALKEQLWEYRVLLAVKK